MQQRERMPRIASWNDGSADGGEGEEEPPVRLT
jgi:hypothetical protein